MSEIKDAINKDSDKYKVALKFINKILTNLGKAEVADLLEFKDIDREDIIKDINKKAFTDMEKELFKYFDKVKSNWYKRKNVLHYILTFLRYLCSDIGLSFDYRKKDINTTIDNKNFRRTHVYYSISQTQ